MHHACVFINQQKYIKSNELLTHIINEAYQQGVIGVRYCAFRRSRYLEVRTMAKGAVTHKSTSRAYDWTTVPV
jgi:hypothetical protein